MRGQETETVTGKANSVGKGAGADLGFGAESQCLESHGASSLKSWQEGATRLRVASRQEKAQGLRPGGIHGDQQEDTRKKWGLQWSEVQFQD